MYVSQAREKVNKDRHFSVAMRNSAKEIFLIKSQLLYQLSYAPCASQCARRVL
jgi:hypothetical protein